MHDCGFVVIQFLITCWAKFASLNVSAWRAEERRRSAGRRCWTWPLQIWLLQILFFVSHSSGFLCVSPASTLKLELLKSPWRQRREFLECPRLVTQNKAVIVHFLNLTSDPCRHLSPIVSRCFLTPSSPSDTSVVNPAPILQNIITQNEFNSCILSKWRSLVSQVQHL